MVLMKCWDQDILMCWEVNKKIIKILIFIYKKQNKKKYFQYEYSSENALDRKIKIFFLSIRALMLLHVVDLF